ncbi:uncharacterized protein B0H18DRAFT_879111 [Fomitopsis serialis]|uniref:uncharacterized protein n=1 Tax=Fomitopsis serialis TaxID=139415 RepID=UPI002008CC76|nr:uncharacterized protein B0H18DRAFT_879111 [Neoantrodia serialis]KAH9922729.1 hypothetical protein B0H18DRAFT_879111 [Neoantrodia serialis]
MDSQTSPAGSFDLRGEFYSRFNQYVTSVQATMSAPTDSTVLERLGDDLDQFSQLVHQEHTGGRGRPRYVIDRDWLAWAYQQRSTSGIAQFLQVSRTVVRNALLEYGIAEPQASPFPLVQSSSETSEPHEEGADDDLLHPVRAWPPESQPQVASYTGPLSTLTDSELDDLIFRLRQHYIRAGLAMLDGMLRRLGHRIPRTRIRESLLRIDPVHRVFERIRIRRRKYQVAGPNALWHHDGQHVAYIHNVRIERLWVDVTAQVGSKWAEFFMQLELRYGLDPQSDLHIWLLQYLFLDDINAELEFFAEGWNHHRIQIRNGPNCSPADMFGFDMLVHGVRGDQLPEEALSEEELEVYGVDWEALREERLLHSHHANNAHDDGWSSWIGRSGPPEHMNEVPVQALEDPALTNLSNTLAELRDVIHPWAGRADSESLTLRWINSLLLLQARYPNLFL